MRSYLESVWYGNGRAGWPLIPLSWLFALIVRIRRWLYARDILHVSRAARPVIVVGNLSVGGTGKTPLVLWLARALAEQGLRPGIISRGYGVKLSGVHRVTAESPAAEVGDEPRLLARRSGVPVAVGRDRAAAAALLAADTDVIISDDGLQHYALGRELEIAVLDGARGLGNGRLLPAGPLREGRRRLNSVDFVVANGGGGPSGSLRMDLVPTALVRVRDGYRESLEAWRGRRVHAVAGIGNPQRFFATLQTAGLDLVTHAFADHASYAGTEFDFADDLPVLMTEKDAVKYERWASARHWFLEVDAVLPEADARRLMDAVLHLFALKWRGLPILE